MNNALIELVAANITFVGLHFAMSHPLRAPLVGVVGEKLFPALYSLVSFAALAWVYLAYKAAPAVDLGGSGEAGWMAATILTLPAMVLFAGSFAGNPAMPAPGAEAQARKEPRGVFLVTRHPMMWGFGLWALTHVILFWSLRSVITAVAMRILALVGAHLQDRKKEALMGEAWAEWESKTSYWPRWGKLFTVGMKWCAAGIVVWLLFTFAHIHAAGVPAGIWRWLG
ncbi:NnrU family protein [Altererythrobacter arenosus]|uniref:NnrU family protein n=1 Tax=Altererythrobacter arenosus TaxID=3032592 RepID=A0ABY8FU47_9SPHN|nr:NnrU family protein [Altererythrobacter sp. CAU 1644]WFL78537.1 NnrU family protein [Altererythrobacter sp. CAU 1644]